MGIFKARSSDSYPPELHEAFVQAKIKKNLKAEISYRTAQSSFTDHFIVKTLSFSTQFFKGICERQIQFQFLPFVSVQLSSCLLLRISHVLLFFPYTHTHTHTYVYEAIERFRRPIQSFLNYV